MFRLILYSKAYIFPLISLIYPDGLLLKVIVVRWCNNNNKPIYIQINAKCASKCALCANGLAKKIQFDKILKSLYF